MTTEIAVQEEAIKKEVTPIKAQANALIVEDPVQRSVAIDLIKIWKDLKASIEERFTPTANRKKALDLWQSTKDTENAFYEPIDEAIAIATKKVKDFNTEEAKRVERDRQAEESRRREAERKERERLDAIAMEEALKAEKAKKEAKDAEERKKAAEIEAEEAKIKKAEAAIAGDKTAEKVADIQIAAKEKEAKTELRAAEKAIETAKVSADNAEIAADQASTVELAPKFTPPPVAVKKLVWKCKVVSVKIACRSVYEGLIDFNGVEFKQSTLNEIGKNYDGKTRIAGLEFWQESTGRI